MNRPTLLIALLLLAVLALVFVRPRRVEVAAPASTQANRPATMVKRDGAISTSWMAAHSAGLGRVRSVGSTISRRRYPGITPA